jgi:hypothetical protein
LRFTKLLVNDKGLDDFAGHAIPYDPSHRYEVAFTGVSGEIKLAYSDSIYVDNTGSY